MKEKQTQKFIIRCDKAGVFYGEVKSRTGDEAEIANVRRVHGWDGACSLSQLATEGVKTTGGNNRWTVVVPAMTVLGVIELIPVPDNVQQQLDGLPVWRRD